MAAPPPAPRSFSLLRTLIVLLAMAAVAFGLFKWYGTTDLGNYTTIPKEYRFTYVPADFEPMIDMENAVVVLQNPYRYNREFNQLVQDFNLSLLGHVANRMNLPDTVRAKVRDAYATQHRYLAEMYFDDFTQLVDTTAIDYDTWYESGGQQVVESFREVASKYTCFLINTVLNEAIEAYDGRIGIKGAYVDTPCGVALTEGFQPMMDRLKRQAAIRDFSRTKGFMEERVEKTIAELATLEIRDKKGLTKQLKTKLLGVNVSTTDIDISAISVLKMGFDLNKYFEVRLDEGSNEVVVTLPQPEILSHEVYPKIDKLDIGWMREVQDADFNKNFDLLRREFRREALEGDARERSRAQAEVLMQTLLEPIVKNISQEYRLRVAFQGEEPSTILGSPKGDVPVERSQPVSAAAVLGG